CIAGAAPICKHRGKSAADQLAQRCSQLLERLSVDFTFEVNYLTQRVPETYTAPIIKFWGPAGIQVNASFTGIQQQQIPLLLLANANRIGALSDQILGQLVIQPAARGSDDLNVLWIQTHFFLQLSEQRLLQPLTVPDSPLRELPGFL